MNKWEKNKFISNEDVKNNFGVDPGKVIDVQALAGDSSDNVPGVPGIAQSLDNVSLLWLYGINPSGLILLRCFISGTKFR